MKSSSISRCLSTTALILTASPLLAGDGTTYNYQAPQVSYATESPWEAELSLYGWLANLDGAVGIAGTVSPLDLGFDDVVDNLDMVAAGTFGLRKGKVGVFADFMYIEVSPSFATPGPLFGRTDLSLSQTMLDLKASYRIAEWDRGWLDLLAGARYMYVDLDITLQPGLLPARAVSGSEGWWDAVGGIRLRHNLTDRLFLTCLADVGGGSSEVTWQALAGIGYQMSERIHATLAYRYMGYDYGDGGFLYDVDTQGIGLGLGLTW